MATTNLNTTQGLLSGIGNIYASNQAAGASTDIANALLAQGQQAAEMTQFRPVGITSRFGTSGFQFDDKGRLIGAGYQVAPDVAAMREALLSQAGQAVGGAAQAQPLQQAALAGGTGLFNLGQQYVAESPEAARQRYMSQQQALLAPGREQQLAQLTNQQQQQGRLGLAVGGTQAGYTPGGAGLMATNPQMAAYYNAIAQQDAQLAAQAQQAAIQQAQAGQGLMTGGLNVAGGGYGLQTQALAPFTTALTGATSAEALGQAPLTVGSTLGQQQATAGAAAGQFLTGSAKTAADYQAQAAKAQTGVTQGLVDPVSKLISGLLGG